MKKKLKKVMSLVLAVLMIFSLFTVAMAAEDVTPVIVVSGMGAFPLYNVDSGESAFPIPTEKITKNVAKLILPTVSSAVFDDWSIFSSYAMKPLYDLFDAISCDENGNSVYNVTAQVFPESAANYKDTFEDGQASERGVVRKIADEIGWENVYYFYYDWRNNPLDIAQQLRQTVEKAKSETGSDKVSFFAMSFGGMIASSYLYKYGSADIKNLVYGSTAFQGVDMVGKLFSNQIDLNISEAIEYLSSVISENEFIASLVGLSGEALDKYGKNQKTIVDTYLRKMVNELSLPLYQQVFKDTFAHFKGMWCMVPSKFYQQAKTYMKNNCDVSDSFFESVDEYIYEVQEKTSALIETAQTSGTNVYIIGAYNYAEIPVTVGDAAQTDMLIDTYLMTGNCTVAPFGETLTQDCYESEKTCLESSHKHLSTDGVVDASTAILPEQTWIIKNMKHVEYNVSHQTSDLALWLITSQTRQNVSSNEKYPQFTQLDRESGKLISLTDGVTLAQKQETVQSAFTKFFTLLLNIVEKLMSFISK